MVNSNSNALGIIFPNSCDETVPELVNLRLMASIPFASRYRMVDFILSSMVNSGIDNVSILVRKNYHSLMDHLGSGREWDLTRKSGGLNIVPPYSEKTVGVYRGHVEALASILPYLRSRKEKYVVLSDSNIAMNFDFSAMLKNHIESGADVSVAYHEAEIPAYLRENKNNDKGFYYTLAIDGTSIKKMYINPHDEGIQNLCLSIYIMDRELLIEQINTAYVRGLVYFERDVLCPQLDILKVNAYKFEGYCARISGMKSYFDENMKLLDDNNLDALFSANPIYTKIRDDNPTRYINGSKVTNVMAADGCVIEGEVENSILFRGVKIGKGAKVKNCVLMQDTVVEEGANVEHVITDKRVTICAGNDLKGTDVWPVYIAKNHRA